MKKYAFCLFFISSFIAKTSFSQITHEQNLNKQALINAFQNASIVCSSAEIDPEMEKIAFDYCQDWAQNFYVQTLSQPGNFRIQQIEFQKSAFSHFPGVHNSAIFASATAESREEASHLLCQTWQATNPSYLSKTHDRIAYALVSTDPIPGLRGSQWFGCIAFSNGLKERPRYASDGREQSRYNALLLQEVMNLGAKSANGSENQKMMDIAAEFANECASNYYARQVFNQTTSKRLEDKLMDHVGFEDRAAHFPGHTASEILATVTAPNAETAAKELARNWFNSPGHNASMMPYHAHHAYVMIRTGEIPGHAGYQWFAVGLFAD